jgi:hypothetical protein
MERRFGDAEIAGAKLRARLIDRADGHHRQNEYQRSGEQAEKSAFL